MNRIAALKGVPILALSIVLAACGQASAEGPSASPVPSERPSQAPVQRPSQQPSVRPSSEPAEGPSVTPTAPSAPPVATPKPFVLVEHPVPMIGRVTADGVAVRNLPDLESGIVNGNDAGDVVVDEIRLRRGDDVIVFFGPVVADGYSWYEVMAGGTGPADYFRGWIAGEFLEHLDDAAILGPVLSLDGQGFSASASGHVGSYAPLMVNHAVTPLAGDESCTFAMTLVGTRGQLIELVPQQVVTEARVGQVFAGNLEELYMDVEGDVTLDVTSDCSFAAAISIPQG
jgi:hypothetical protein